MTRPAPPPSRVALALGLLLALAWVFASPALAAPVELRVQPTDPASASEARVALQVAAPGGLGALEVEVVYDPGVLAFHDAEEASLLSNGMLEHHVVAPGRVRLALVSSDPITTEGTIAVLTFAVKEATSTTEIALESASAWDHENVFEMQVRTTNATFDPSATAGTKLGPVAIAFLAGLAVLLLVGIALARRSRRS